MALVLPQNLTSTQEAIWLDQQLFTGKPIYNTGQVLSIRGNLRVDLFERALRETVAESPGLRLPRIGRPACNLMLLDLRTEKNPLGAAEKWMRNEMRRVISLSDPALFRFALLRVNEDHWLWFQKYHHIIIDGTGRRLLSERTARRYRALRLGEPYPSLPSLPPKNSWLLSGATQPQTLMKSTVSIGWSNSLNGPDLFSKSIGRTRNASNPDLMHALISH